MRQDIVLPPLADDQAYFQAIRDLSNHYWIDVKISDSVYGYQIQPGSRWRPGLTEKELMEFEREMGFDFPVPLRNFYLTMNGLDKPGVNVYGNCGESYAYWPKFYSFPDDLDRIWQTIQWILRDNNLTREDLPSRASRIFPFFAHRCVLIDEPGNPVLSMHGNDIIFWSSSLSGALVRDIFNLLEEHGDFRPVQYWLDEPHL
jgi:hypothetical protein